MIGLEAQLTHIDAGNAAPRLSLKALDGKTHSLESHLEHGPVVLAFFKTSCPVCQFTLPFLQRISERFAGSNVSVIGISQDDLRSTKDFNQEYGLNFPTLIDDAGYPASNAYGLTNVPTIFLIAPDGTVKVSCMGFDKAALETIAGELAQHQKVSAPALFRPDEIIPAYKPG